MDYSGYVVTAVSIAVYMICFMLHSIDKINNKYLPLIAGILGIVLNIWYSKSFDFSVFLGGLVSGLSATGIDQLIKVAKKD